MATKVITSEKYTLIKEDLKSLLIGLGITLLGAGLTYLTEAMGKMDFGEFSPIIVAVWALIVNIVRKYITVKQYVK